MPERPPSAHWLDHLVAFTAGRGRLFKHGWGNEALLDRLATVARFEHPPAPIAVEWSPLRIEGAVGVGEGRFRSPVEELPIEAREAVVQRIVPAFLGDYPVYVVLAASGEEGFGLRSKVFRPLVERAGVGVVLLENAMVGLRRPRGQKGAEIRTVSDHLLMNVAMVEEARALIEHFAEAGHERLGICGYSMGGSMAALVAAVVPRPIAAAVFAAGGSGTPVFTEGLLSTGLDFATLGAGHGGVTGAKARLGAIFGAADLDRYPVPRCPRAAVLVGARRDGYVFPAQIEALHARWSGSALRWVDSGHAATWLFQGEVLRRAAEDAMTRLREEPG